MKKIITLITIMAMMILSMFAFAACGNKEEAVKEEVVEETAPVEEENNPLADTLWEAKGEDGTVLSSVKFNKDGTFEYIRIAVEDWAISHGTYEVEGNNIKTTHNDEEFYKKLKENRNYDDKTMNTAKEYDNTAIWTFDENTLTIKYKGMEGKNANGFPIFPESEAIFTKSQG